MTIQVTITPNGRMVLPIGIRRELGLSDGGVLVLERTEDGVILRTAEQIIARSQALARQFSEGKTGASVDDFLAERRAESGE